MRSMTRVLLAPVVIQTCREEYPAVWVLALAPACTARAQVMSQAHWLRDVMAGGQGR